MLTMKCLRGDKLSSKRAAIEIGQLLGVYTGHACLISATIGFQFLEDALNAKCPVDNSRLKLAISLTRPDSSEFGKIGWTTLAGKFGDQRRIALQKLASTTRRSISGYNKRPK